MPNWMNQGKHRYYWEADMLWFQLHGLFFLEDTQLLVALTESITAKHGYYLTVFDARDGINMTPEARRYVSEKSRISTMDGATLIVGASLAMRVMAHLMQNAAKLFGAKQTPVEFCNTLEEVPQWLEAQRRRLHGKLAGRGADR
jgi:hypothetical protein